MAKGDYSLCVKSYDGRVLNIPFKKIVKLDELTVNFANPHDLVEFLIDALDIKMTQQDVERVYISYVTTNFYYNSVRKDAIAYGTSSEFPVKYTEDNFSIEDLKFVYAKYLKDNYRRILHSNIRYLQIDSILRYINANGSLTDSDIDFAVNRCFELKNPEGRFIREIYFEVKNKGYIVKLNKAAGRTYDRKMEEYEARDEYSEYLMEVANKQPDRVDEVMEEIAGDDIEDIKSKFLHNGVGIVDGVTAGKYYYGYMNMPPSLLNMSQYDKLLMLSYFTGLGIDELYEKAMNFSTGNGRKR